MRAACCLLPGVPALFHYSFLLYPSLRAHIPIYSCLHGPPEVGGSIIVALREPSRGTPCRGLKTFVPGSWCKEKPTLSCLLFFHHQRDPNA